MRDPRPWTHAALFGALWGAVESTVGTSLHLMRVPFAGLALGVVALLAMVTARRLHPRPGVCVLAGAVAALIKVFVLGGPYPGPLIGIMAQALMVELAMTLIGGRPIGAVVGGAAAFAVGPLQKVAMTWIVAGSEAVGALLTAADAGLSWIGLPGLRGIEVVAAMVAFSGGLGAAAGLLAWRVSERVLRRLGRSQ